ncbi:SRPBCC domain-containing protein [Sphingobacterium sp. SGL-16]|uniref:SRPBCC family protein n=1 Tax=Sphingobacterium sp. SGL-16 TaxID=2710883 RepID=UPI0013E9E96D|nr:SRPBCC domain-containing protein [Sphingobacterium sp. SGL-16]NGM74542.1 SRPBCC domain-containing protein [Sphingobacterium sp. SGL-16]
MKRDLAYDFLIDIPTKTIKIKKEFAADPSLVWQAWTSSDWLDQWWGPKPWHVETKTLDFIPNSIWLYAMVGPEAEKHWALSQYIEINEGHSFSHKDGFCDEDGIINQDMPQSTWNVTFTPADKHTVVDCIITYDSKEAIEGVLEMGFQEGISMCLKQLDELFERTSLNT